MKHINISLAMAAAFASAASAANGLIPDSILLEKDGNLLHLEMQMNLTKVDIRSNQAFLITPVVFKADSSYTILKSIGIYGHDRYIQYRRENHGMITNGFEETYKAGKVPEDYIYTYSLPWEDWMSGANVYLRMDTYGCCHTILGEGIVNIGYAPVIEDPYPLVQEVESPAIERFNRIFTVYFPLNSSDVEYKLGGNNDQIAEMTTLLKNAKDTQDVVIKSITINGYSSPEGSYDKNSRLAERRANAVRQIIYNVDSNYNDYVSTGFFAEDWRKLRDYTDDAKIIEILDSDEGPDIKGNKLKSANPRTYNNLLRKCPDLRRVEVSIDYDKTITTTF